MEMEHFSAKALVTLVQAKACTSSVPQMLLPPVSWGAFEPVQHPGEIDFLFSLETMGYWTSTHVGQLCGEDKDTKTSKTQTDTARNAFP